MNGTFSFTMSLRDYLHYEVILFIWASKTFNVKKLNQGGERSKA